MLLPSSIVSDYYSQVPGAEDNQRVGGYTFPCSADAPSFTVDINGYKATVPGNLVKYAPIRQGSSTCFGGIQSNSGLGFSILGDTFLKSQYAVFDSQGPRVGFAPQA